jgi:hypothetical protein
MNEGYQGGQPSTLHGTFNPEDSTLSGRWVNTPPTEQGDFLFILGPNNTFTGWFSGDSDTSHTQLAWSGSLKRQHIDIEGGRSPIPIPPPPSLLGLTLASSRPFSCGETAAEAGRLRA